MFLSTPVAFLQICFLDCKVRLKKDWIAQTTLRAHLMT